MSDPNRESDRQQESPLGADDIYRKLEERAIAESNGLNQRVAHCQKCRGKEFLPVVGSGHPYGDVLLLKYQPRYLEVSEGVAFFGRGGGAILKSVQRLGVDPLLLYGTNIVKCPEIDQSEAEDNCPVYFLEEFQILSLIHISEPTRLRRISYAVFCLKKKKKKNQTELKNNNYYTMRTSLHKTNTLK